MKRLLLSLIAALLLIGNTQAYETKVNFKTNRSGKFILYVNGQKVNYKPARYVSLDYLPAGRNDLKVRYFGYGQPCDVYQTIHLRRGFETSYNISTTKYGGLNFHRTSAVSLYNRGYSNDGFHNNRGFARNNAQFTDFLYALDQKRFDQKKLIYATAYLENNYVSTRQLIKILNGLSFDDTKVELIIYAYDHVTDPQNFYLVYDQLRFRSSIRRVKSELRLGGRAGRRY